MKPCPKLWIFANPSTQILRMTPGIGSITFSLLQLRMRHCADPRLFLGLRVLSIYPEAPWVNSWPLSCRKTLTIKRPRSEKKIFFFLLKPLVPRGTFTKVLKGRDSVAGTQSAKSGHQDSLLFIIVVLSSPRLGSAFPEPWSQLSQNLRSVETL